MENIREEVATINQQTLYKSTFDSNNQESYSVVEYKKVMENIAYVYWDIDKIIRKSTHLTNHPEFSGFTIHYYDRSGNVIYTITKTSSALNPSITGVKASEDGHSIYTDIQLNDDNDKVIMAKEFWTNEDDVAVGDVIYNINSVSDLQKHLKQVYNATNLTFNDNTQIRFSLPLVGEKTFINVRRLNMRESPTLDSGILTTGGLGTSYCIIEILDKPALPGGLWYKIKSLEIETYILAQFLEPIERVRKK